MNLLNIRKDDLSIQNTPNTCYDKRKGQGVLFYE